jgi:hypothetical protein
LGYHWHRSYTRQPKINQPSIFPNPLLFPNCMKFPQFCPF